MQTPLDENNLRFNLLFGEGGETLMQIWRLGALVQQRRAPAG